MSVFDIINAGLQGNTKPAQDYNSGGKARATSSDPTNKAGYGGKFDSTGRDSIRDKLKALGLDSMPEGGQEELDRMWQDHVAKGKGAMSALGTMKKR